MAFETDLRGNGPFSFQDHDEISKGHGSNFKGHGKKSKGCRPNFQGHDENFKDRGEKSKGCSSTFKDHDEKSKDPWPIGKGKWEIWQRYISREEREGGEGKRLFPPVFFASFARHTKSFQTRP
jgi:hypothetical protein